MLDYGYYNLDCMEGMKEFQDNFFDLAVVDPPYGINYIKGGVNKTGVSKTHRTKYKEFGGEDMSPPSQEYFDELFRVSNNQIIWGGVYFTDKLPVSNCWLVWDKKQTLKTYADGELAWTSFKGQVKIFHYTWNGMLQEDMKNKEKRIHPTQKPIALYKWIFENFAEPGMKILDTHVGSASSLIAAHETGMKYVGFEIDEYYYKKSKERLDQYTAQVNIFDCGIGEINGRTDEHI